MENSENNEQQEINKPKSNKITLVALFVLLTITVFFRSNSEVGTVIDVPAGAVLSINEVLSFAMPDGYRDAYEVSSLAEVFIVDEVAQNSMIADVLYTNELSVDEFFEAQSYVLQTLEPVNSFESTYELSGGRTVTNKTYVFDFDGVEFYHNINVIETGKDYYIGVLASLEGIAENEKVEGFISSIAYTGENVENYRVVKDESETINITLPPQWKKLSRDGTNNFVKLGDNYEVSLNIEVVLKDEYSSVDDFFDEVTYYLSDSVGLEDFDIEVEELGKSTMHSKLFTNNMEDLFIYGYFFVTEFDGLDEYVVSTVNIVGYEPIETFEEEVKEMIKSIAIN